MIDDAALDDQIGRRIGTGGLEVDALIRNCRIEEAVRDDDLLQRSLDSKPRTFVRLEQAALNETARWDP